MHESRVPTCERVDIKIIDVKFDARASSSASSSSRIKKEKKKGIDTTNSKATAFLPIRSTVKSTRNISRDDVPPCDYLFSDVIINGLLSTSIVVTLENTNTLAIAGDRSRPKDIEDNIIM